MNKIAVLGLIEERTDLLKSLMEFGAVDINQEEPSDDIQDKAFNPNVQSDLSKIDSYLTELSRALDILARYAPVKKSMFSARRIVSESDYTEIVGQKSKIMDYAHQINALEDEITRLKGDENRIGGLLSSLNPWLELDIPLDITNTRYTFCYTGSLPSATDLKAFEDELLKEFPESALLFGKSDRDHHYVVIIGHKDIETEIMNAARNWGFNRITLRDAEGNAGESKARFEVRLKSLQEKREQKISAINELVHERNSLEAIFDSCRMERSRIEAKSRLVSTRKSFLLKGWLPANISEKVNEYLNKHFFCVVEIEAPAKDEEFPVLLKNGPIVEAISPIINMYGVPSSLEIDPSPVTFPFYIFFFGLMLGDGGYGLIIALIMGFILKKFRLEDSTRRFIKLLFFCGLSTIVAGFLFGSWFGISSLTKTALWIVPTEKPELMMSYTILIGIIHMYTGLFMKALNLIRRGHVLDAVFDVGFIYVMFTGFILSLLPYAPGISVPGTSGIVNAGHYIFVTGIALVLLTNGRKSKSIFGKIFGGLPRLYDIVSFFSDCLSYTRILALGLASSIIGDIVNTLSSAFGGNIVFKVILMTVVLLFGHILNFLLNALGAYVHSCRLQFLEFFGKFLEGGGQAFKPLKADTKYIIIQTETSAFLNSGLKTGIV
jgi:V/A-type H+-transporting ATPase subunit I